MFVSDNSVLKYYFKESMAILHSVILVTSLVTSEEVHNQNASTRYTIGINGKLSCCSLSVVPELVMN